MDKKNRDKKEVYVAILTPYLTIDLVSLTSDCNGCKNIQKCTGCPSIESFLEEQKSYGYEANNFNGIDQFSTENHIVMLETPKNHKLPNKTSADFAVAGNTFEGEMEVRVLSQSGLIVARYSTFYPDRSDYTGSMPAEAGYSLDIPKKVPIVKAFITDDAVLDALVSREEARIRSAVDNFNKGRDEPVLITPYLSEALRLKK